MRGLGYVPALDGIRGIAIAMVVGLHLYLIPPGGNAGVDLFFVLSGFLITTLLLEELAEHGRISLVGFYVRRARRLLPALAVMLAAYALVVAARGGDPFRSVVLGGLYIGNIVQAAGDSRIHNGALRHLWSLAQEEQFYLVWPWVLLVCARSRRMVGCLAALFVALCLYRIGLALGGGSRLRIVFAPDTRADGLVAGALLAGIRMRGGLAVGEWAGKTGVAVAAAGAVAARATVGWTSYGLPFFDLGACLLVAAAVSDTELAGWLGSRPLVWLGQRSYSLYLWHVPVLYAVALGGLGLGQPARLLILASSLGCAELSYRFVERPFRRRRTQAIRAPAAAESAPA